MRVPLTRSMMKSALCVWGSEGWTKKTQWCLPGLGCVPASATDVGVFGLQCHHLAPLCHNSRPLEFLACAPLRLTVTSGSFYALLVRLLTPGVGTALEPPDLTLLFLLPWDHLMLPSGVPWSVFIQIGTETQNPLLFGSPWNKLIFLFFYLSYLKAFWVGAGPVLGPGQRAHPGLILRESRQVPLGKSETNTFIFPLW